jgi:hypothetical protein
MTGERAIPLAGSDRAGRGRPGLRPAPVTVCLPFCVALFLFDRSRLDSVEGTGL